MDLLLLHVWSTAGPVTPRFIKVSETHSVVKKYVKFLLTELNRLCAVSKQEL